MAYASPSLGRLPLFGPAQLSMAGTRVPLRSKSLAILYYLAVEGPVSRATLAELLWEHASARQNLRVELHELRHVLGRYGIAAFERRSDPLRLPEGVALDTTPRTGQIMEGLEDVSPSYREWLQGLRGRNTRADDPPLEQIHAQAQELAAAVRPPFLLMVRGSPLAGFRSFAVQLARALGLPFLEGTEGSAAAVRYLPLPQSAAQVRRVLADDRSVWVLPTAPFGEDHSTLLELRARWPAERARFVELRPLTWPEAVQGPLRSFPMPTAASIYLRSGGDAAHLRQLAELCRVERGTIPLPQQVRASYQRESRFLSYPARLALERLSAHPGVLDEGVIQALTAEGYLDELERRGWLRYEGGWTFASEPARRVLYAALQPGRRAEYHRLLARHFATVDEPIARCWHEEAAGLGRRPAQPPTGLPAWARAVWSGGPGPPPPSAEDEPVRPRDEVWLEPPEVQGGDWQPYAERFVCVRNGPAREEAALQLPPLEEDVVVRMRGRGWEENVLGVGLDGDAVPLEVEVEGVVVLVLGGVETARALDGPELHPLGAFDVAWCWPAGTRLSLRCRAERAVVDFKLEAYRPRGGRISTPRPVRLTL